MKILIATFSLIGLMLFSSGCGIAYENNRAKLLASATLADYGQKPPDNYQERESDIIRDGLKDPDSAKFKFGDLYQDAIQSHFASPTPVLVWRSDVRVNAKNSYGGYTGFQPYHFAWRDGRIFAIAGPLMLDNGTVTDGIWTYQK